MYCAEQTCGSVSGCIGKAHVALTRGLAACQKGSPASFITAVAFAMDLGPVAAPWRHWRADEGSRQAPGSRRARSYFKSVYIIGKAIAAEDEDWDFWLYRAAKAWLLPPTR